MKLFLAFFTKASQSITDGPTDGPTDRRTDGHMLLKRCEDASKNSSLKILVFSNKSGYTAINFAQGISRRPKKDPRVLPRAGLTQCGLQYWSIWLVTLPTCITRPADMRESCAMAYLKDFFIAFMLYFIPILPYYTNSIIFVIKMKSPTPQICQENSPFKKSEEIWIPLWSPTEIWRDFIKDFITRVH